MAQTKNKPSHRKLSKSVDLTKYIKDYANMNHLKKLIFDPKYVYITCWGLLIFEVILNIFIIHRVKYTEIDWIAYMQEVEGFLNGTLDYKQLKGDTGPLVYPAGFVYVYSVFYYLTSYGRNVRLAQYIFLMIYVAQTYLTFEIYRKTQKVPPYALILCTLTSYRIHSIYVLRLFNDPIAVLFFYVGLNLFLSNKWILGSVFYSLAVSVKMNVLLYAPCLLVAYLTQLSRKDAVINLIVCAIVQLILGAPFLYTNAWSYIKASFDIGRVFEHKWTVNYRFLHRDFFEDRYFHVGLLFLHVSLLLFFLPSIKKYLSSYATLNKVIGDLKKSDESRDSKLSHAERKFADSFERQLKAADARTKKSNRNDEVKEKEVQDVNYAKIAQLFVLPFFVTNLIGIACARSLHYQFYSWYFHSLLYLAHCTTYRKPVVFLILAVVEFCWNAYPSTELSSAMLHVCHVVLIHGVYKTMKQ